MLEMKTDCTGQELPELPTIKKGHPGKSNGNLTGKSDESDTIKKGRKPYELNTIKKGILYLIKTNFFKWLE